jgi:hypothetical protein
LLVTDDMFEGSESWWEPPAGAELACAVTFHTSVPKQAHSAG